MHYGVFTPFHIQEADRAIPYFFAHVVLVMGVVVAYTTLVTVYRRLSATNITISTLIAMVEGLCVLRDVRYKFADRTAYDPKLYPTLHTL